MSEIELGPRLEDEVDAVQDDDGDWLFGPIEVPDPFGSGFDE